jgi:type I restriction enzyme R subunit
MPLSVIELKNAADENTTTYSAYKQIETYKQETPQLFNYNEITVISDGIKAEAGTITSSKEWFLPWKTIEGKEYNKITQLEVLLRGMFNKDDFLQIIKHFISFNKTDKDVSKILGGYHQFNAANNAIEKTIDAYNTDGKVGVIWHTQGSGKSLIMAFYASMLAVEPKLKNPTLVVLTDRNDLDDQLFQTFSSTSILRDTPIHVKTKEKLKEALKNRASGGVIFATIQKFGDKDMGTLSTRKNIIVAADEAHRSQYGFEARVDKKTQDIKYGLAKYLRDALPNACVIGLTGTPIDFKDKSTRKVFGKYIDIYDIEKAVEDKRTVRIYYEPKIINVGMNIKELDKEIEDLLEEEYPGEDEEPTKEKEKIKSRWSRVEAVVGSEKRIETLAQDIVKHFEKKQEGLNGKAMIVCMSRRICVKLHDEIKKLKPKWYSKDDEKGLMKVIMTGSAADGPKWQEHIRDKTKRKNLGTLFKKPGTGFKLAIVRDMWLTGFDAPCMNTLYIDKPMKGHGLMQAIARVNRVYKGKEGGLVVDYLGIGHELKMALKDYSQNGGKGKPSYNQDVAITAMNDRYDVVKNLFSNFNYMKFFEGTPRDKMNVVSGAMNHILSLKDGKKRFFREVVALTGAFSLANPSPEADKIRDEVALFQTIKASMIKTTGAASGRTKEELDESLNQIVSKSIASKGVLDIFESIGIDKPNISVLSDEFLYEVENMEHKNLAVEALKKLLEDQIRVNFRKNIVKTNKFSEMLLEALSKYKANSITSAMVVDQLADIARQMREEKEKGHDLGLSEDEEAFYDALAKNQSARDLLGGEKLVEISHELRKLIKNNKSVDWSIKENVQAKLRVKIKQLLRKYGYPPDKTRMAADLVLSQANNYADFLDRE